MPVDACDAYFDAYMTTHDDHNREGSLRGRLDDAIPCTPVVPSDLHAEPPSYTQR